MSTSSLQFGPEWMRKAPSSNSSSSNANKASPASYSSHAAAAAAAPNQKPATSNNPAAKRNPSLSSMNSGGPAPVLSPSAGPSPGGFSFAAAAAGGGSGGGSSGGGGGEKSMAAFPSAQNATGGLQQRDHSHQSLSLYSSKEGSRGSLSPTAPDSHDDGGNGGLQQKRKLFNDRDAASRRSISTEGGNGALPPTNGPLSPSIGAEPRGLNARGSASGERDANALQHQQQQQQQHPRPGLFQRVSSTGTGAAKQGATNPGDSPTTPRERFSGIQGGVLSGVAPPERRRKESEGGSLRNSRHPIASAHSLEDATLWERGGAASGTPSTGAHSAAVANGAQSTAEGLGLGGDAHDTSGGEINKSATSGSWAGRAARRERAPGEGPIGPPADGSGGFSKFAGYDRKRERTAGHTADSWRSTSGSHPTAANGTENHRNEGGIKDGESHASAADAGQEVASLHGDASVDETTAALAQLAASDTRGPSADPASSAAAPPAPPPAPWSADDQTWWYRDPSGQVQGPFAAALMQDWYEQSYFTRELMVRPDQEAEYHPLDDYVQASGRNPKLFLIRPPSLTRPEVPAMPVEHSTPMPPQHQEPPPQQQPSPFHQHQHLSHGFPAGDVSSPMASHHGLGGQSAWGEQHLHQQQQIQHHPYLDGVAAGGWPSQHHPHLQQQLGFGPFGNGYGSPFRGHVGLPGGGGGGGDMSLDARLRQQEEYVAMIRHREMEEQAARQSAAARGLSFGQFSAGGPGGGDVFGSSATGNDRPWLPRESSTWSNHAVNGDGAAGGGAHQSPWAAPRDSSNNNARHGGGTAPRAPWDESFGSEQIQPIGTPVRARSPINAGPVASEAQDTPGKAGSIEAAAQQQQQQAAVDEDDQVEIAASLSQSTTDPPASEPAESVAAAPDEAAAPPAAAATPPPPSQPQSEDPAPEQDWPQSPSAVEFAAEPEFNSQPAIPAGGAHTAAHDRKGRNAVVSGKHGAEAMGAADTKGASPSTTTSAAAGNVKVVSADQFRKGGRGDGQSQQQQQQPSTSVQTPLSSLLPGAPTSASATPSAKAAPWAQQAEPTQQQSSALSLREIQEAEARQAEAKRAAERAAAAQRRAAAAANGSASPSATKLPTTMSWGLASIPSSAKTAGPGSASGGVSTATGGRESPIATPAPAAWTAGKAAPRKTLTEIQEEERKRAAAQQHLKAAQAAAARKAYAESAARQQQHAGASAAPAPGWSVVGAGGKTSSNAANGGAANANAAATPASPAVRPVARNTASATHIPGVAGAWGATNGNQSNAPGGGGGGAAGSATAAARKATTNAVPTSTSNSSSVGSASTSSTTPSPEFLRYCKEQMRGLSVKVDDFIEMLLSFPLDPSPDVIEIIAESIYANSSTLDGRRLANDFVQKRKMDAGISGGGSADGSGSTSSGGASRGAAASQHGFQQVVKKGGRKRN